MFTEIRKKTVTICSVEKIPLNTIVAQQLAYNIYDCRVNSCSDHGKHSENFPRIRCKTRVHLSFTRIHTCKFYKTYCVKSRKTASHREAYFAVVWKL